jgi:hypothetical protein
MYTVFHTDDLREPETGLSLEQAASALLTNDGHDFEIRDDGDAGFSLWHTPFSRNGTLGSKPMVQTVIYSIKGSRQEAEADICQQVIDKGWGPMKAMLDSDFAEMIAQIDAENGDDQ